ncbi:MAG: hypothetical protein AABZ60_08705, partial [Planctomycetota bacterium]
MSYLKRNIKIFVSFGFVHVLLLSAHFFSLQKEEYCPGKENFEDETLGIFVQGGFVQKKTDQEVVIRAKDLAFIIQFKAKRDLFTSLARGQRMRWNSCLRVARAQQAPIPVSWMPSCGSSQLSQGVPEFLVLSLDFLSQRVRVLRKLPRFVVIVHVRLGVANSF